MKLKILTILFLTLGIVACDNSSNPEGSSNSYKVNGVEASKYFSQFIYRIEDPCTDWPEHHSVSNTGTVTVGRDDQGHELIADVDIFLNKDRTVQIKYELGRVLERDWRGKDSR